MADYAKRAEVTIETMVGDFDLNVSSTVVVKSKIELDAQQHAEK